MRMKLKIKTDGRSVDVNGYLDNDWCNFIFFILDLFCCSNDLYWYLSPVQNRRNSNCTFDDATRVGLEKFFRKIIFLQNFETKKEFFSRATLFNGTYNLLDTTDKNCPLYFDTKYEPDYQFRSKSNNSDLDEAKNQEVFTHMRNAQYCYVWKHSNCAQETAI